MSVRHKDCLGHLLDGLNNRPINSAGQEVKELLEAAYQKTREGEAVYECRVIGCTAIYYVMELEGINLVMSNEIDIGKQPCFD